MSADTLDDSDAALSIGRYNMSVGRSYYAMFHIAAAAIRNYLGEDVKDSNKHEYFVGMINKELIHAGHIPSHIGKSINIVMQARRVADYEAAEFTE